MAWILSCCGYGAGQQLYLQFDPLAWELPYTAGVALKRKGKKEERKRKKEREKEREKRKKKKGRKEGKKERKKERETMIKSVAAGLGVGRENKETAGRTSLRLRNMPQGGL